MKTTILKSIFLVAFTTLILAGCVKDDNYETPTLNGCTETTLVKNREVSDILFSTTVTQHTNITPGVEDVIEAYVVSSDIGGNFFKSISFQTLDGSMAFSIPVDASSTFINYEPGRKVLINMTGLYTDIKDSGLRIGGLYGNSSGGAEVGRLPEAEFRNVVQRSCTVVSEDQLVQAVSVAAIQNDNYINRLVELNNVQFDDNAILTTYYDQNNDIGGATNHMLTDAFGTKVVFRTSSYANFSAKSVSSNSGKVRGVLTKYGSTYQFLARSEKDIMFDKPRFSLATPFFSQDFQTVVSNTDISFPGWVNFAESGTWKWRGKTFTSSGSTNGYAEFSAYGSGSTQNTVWLITPTIDLTPYTQKQIKFDVAQHHLDVDSPNNSLGVFISTNFDGTNVTAATWTQLPANIPVKATSWYSFLNSAIDISSYTGNVHVAFKFKGSGTDLTLDGAFQVDNFKALGN